MDDLCLHLYFGWGVVVRMLLFLVFRILWSLICRRQMLLWLVIWFFTLFQLLHRRLDLFSNIWESRFSDSVIPCTLWTVRANAFIKGYWVLVAGAPLIVNLDVIAPWAFHYVHLYSKFYWGYKALFFFF